MFPSKWYIAIILACLLQVSLALPMAKLAARDPKPKGPVADQFGGGNGGSSGADW